MAKERPVEITPSAAALVESLRGLGYSPETAIADLIDNCVAAEAATIKLELEWNDGHPQAALLDNGNGMDRVMLAEALRFGGTGPNSTRTASDLGRFGLGLKTASLSRRQLTIISRTAGVTSALVLDVDEIAKRGWFATVPTALPQHPLATKLLQLEHGTLVLWDRMDSLGGLSGLEKETFYLRLEDIRAHLGMVFHRFINGDATKLAIILNGRPIKAWDPFQTAHPSTRELHSERVRHAGSAFTIRPYVLPHRDRYANEADYEAAGGPGGWGARQGFYVYRGKRLLVAGSWLGLGGVRTWTRDEASRLARIEVDLPTDLDRDWRIDVRKSQARPPGALRARLTAIGGRCRQEAREVFAFRGQGPRARGVPHTAPAIAKHDRLHLAFAGIAALAKFGVSLLVLRGHFQNVVNGDLEPEILRGGIHLGHFEELGPQFLLSGRDVAEPVLHVRSRKQTAQVGKATAVAKPALLQGAQGSAL